MSIVSDADLQNALAVTTVSAQLGGVRNAAEAFVLGLINREFLERARIKEPHNIDRFQNTVFLRERPVTLFSALEQVTSRDTAGTVTGTTQINQDQFVLDSDAGILESLNGGFAMSSFPAGKQVLLASYTAGYTTAQIVAGALREVVLLKELILSITERNWKIRQEQVRHLESISFGDQTARIRFDLTAPEKQIVDDLRLAAYPV